MGARRPPGPTRRRAQDPRDRDAGLGGAGGLGEREADPAGGGGGAVIVKPREAVGRGGAGNRWTRPRLGLFGAGSGAPRRKGRAWGRGRRGAPGRGGDGARGPGASRGGLSGTTEEGKVTTWGPVWCGPGGKRGRVEKTLGSGLQGRGRLPSLRGIGAGVVCVSVTQGPGLDPTPNLPRTLGEGNPGVEWSGISRG